MAKDLGKLVENYSFYQIKEQCKKRDNIINNPHQVGDLPQEDFRDLDLEDIAEVQRLKVLKFVGRIKPQAIVDDDGIASIPRGIAIDPLEKKMQEKAKSVPMICDESDLDDSGAQSRLKFFEPSFGSSHRMCTGEPFADEAFTPNLRTGFVYDRKIIATSAHCLLEDVTKMRFVFGYRISSGTNPPNIISNENIYKGVKVIKQSTSSGVVGSADWALVELDRKLSEDIPILDRRETGIIGNEAKLYAIGYPFGLALKSSKGAIMTKNDIVDVFSASLDAFVSNSGSPVFNEETHKVEGILHFVYGDIKYGRCNRLLRVALADTLGAEVTRITVVTT